jgi:hypothetical protein
MADTNILRADVQTTEEFAKTSFEHLLLRIEATDPVPSTNMNVDVMHAVITTVGCMPKLITLRPALAGVGGGFQVQDLDDLDDAARALQHAHVSWLQTGQQPSALKELTEQARELIDRLFTDATALIRRGHIHAEALKDVKRTNGYRTLIQDLHVLLVVFRGVWSAVQNRTAVQIEELNTAEALVHTLTNVLGAKEQSPAVQAEAALLRRKAYALFMGLYEEVRGAVAFVRRKEGDASSYIPSLYVGRPATRQAEKPELPEAPAAGDDGLHTQPQPAPLPVIAPILEQTVAANGPFKREE